MNVMERKGEGGGGGGGAVNSLSVSVCYGGEGGGLWGAVTVAMYVC